MRTTVSLDPDTDTLVRRRMADRGESFKVALNALIREGAAPRVPFHTATAAMGRSSVNLDRALAVAGQIEDEEAVRKMRSGS
jgi:hypothetical protein